MKKLKPIFQLAIIALAVFLTFKGAQWYYSGKLEAEKEELRREKIKSSKLEEIKEGLYTKLAADTLEINQLRKINDSLGLELKDPKVVTVVKFVPKEVEKPIDSLIVSDSTINVVDNYPNKDNPFVTYKATINKNTEKGIGTFSFTPQEFRLGIGENEDGTFSVNTKVPEFFQITGVDVQALPLAPTKIDNFGWIAGVRVGQDFTDLSNYVKINGGIRYKKLYFSVGAGTNGTVEGGIDIEF